jgi:hypothetical protein
LEERKRRAWRTMQKRTAEKYSEKERWKSKSGALLGEGKLKPLSQGKLRGFCNRLTDLAVGKTHMSCKPYTQCGNLVGQWFPQRYRLALEKTNLLWWVVFLREDLVLQTEVLKGHESKEQSQPR